MGLGCCMYEWNTAWVQQQRECFLGRAVQVAIYERLEVRTVSQQLFTQSQRPLAGGLERGAVEELVGECPGRRNCPGEGARGRGLTWGRCAQPAVTTWITVIE